MSERTTPRRLPRLDVRLGPLLRRAVAEQAERQGVPISAAARMLIDSALARLGEDEEPTATRIERLASLVEHLELLLELVGPVAFGLPSLIAYWAARSETLGVTEDELLEEFWRNAHALWDAELEALAYEPCQEVR